MGRRGPDVSGSSQDRGLTRRIRRDDRRAGAGGCRSRDSHVSGSSRLNGQTRRRRMRPRRREIRNDTSAFPGVRGRFKAAGFGATSGAMAVVEDGAATSASPGARVTAWRQARPRDRPRPGRRTTEGRGTQTTAVGRGIRDGLDGRERRRPDVGRCVSSPARGCGDRSSRHAAVDRTCCTLRRYAVRTARFTRIPGLVRSGAYSIRFR